MKTIKPNKLNNNDKHLLPTAEHDADQLTFSSFSYHKLISSITVSLIFLLVISPICTQVGHNLSQKYYNQSHRQNLNLTYASILQTDDSSLVEDSGNEKSDLFYYILGIIILIASAIIFKQRYKQYFEEKDRLQR